VAPQRTQPMSEHYRRLNRTLIEQRLNLNPQQSERLQYFLWRNSLPEYNTYLYNYFTNNCSTKIRDALDLALDGQLVEQTAGRMTTHTYRWHTRRILSENLFYYIGSDFLLGREADRPLSQWEEMFLPEFMRLHLKGVVNNGVPLVADEQLLFKSTSLYSPQEPPDWLIRFGLAGLLGAGLLLVCEYLSGHVRFLRYLGSILLGFWVVLTAFSGVLLSLMVLFTTHYHTHNNENLLHMSPVALLTVIALPWLRRERNANVITLIGFIAAVITPLLSMLGLACKLLPAFSQDNWQLIVWVLPIHVAVAMILYRRIVKPQKKG